MTLIDLIVFILYVLGNILISIVLSKQINDSADYFAAGRQSSWWLAGLSAFMTMFSAGTFVVWGGIAFRYGFVAVSISMCLGVSALLVGHQLAALWRKSGVSTAAEYIHRRFGLQALQFYTWFNIAYRLLGMAVALYSLAVILQALLPEPVEAYLQRSFQLDTLYTIILFCGLIIVIYTVLGGLWAVLLTDVLQFIILLVAVIIVIPLGLQELGGISGFVQGVPEGFFKPVAGEFGWFFLLGWIVIHYFKIGGEWAFIQRYICVPRPVDAKKASYLFGILYLISPLIWLLPPMMYQVIDPGANPEQAYILTCQAVLPAGLLGLLIASMFAATGSMIDSELNVFASVLTKDFYKRLFPASTEQRQVDIGRVLTILLGVVVVLLAMLVPALGGAEEIVLAATALLAGPMVLPVIWGLYSKKIDQKEVFVTIIISGLCALLLKFGLFNQNSWFTGDNSSNTLLWIKNHSRTLETVVGTVLPLLILLLLEKAKKESSSRYIEVIAMEPEVPVELKPSLLPVQIIAIALGILAAAMLAITLSVGKDDILVLAIFTGLLALLSFVIFYSLRRMKRSEKI